MKSLATSYINYCKLYLLTIIITFLVGCSKKNDTDKCISIVSAPVTKIDGATTATLNQEIILTVSISCNNGCGQFKNYTEVVANNTSTIQVNTIYEGCICTQDLPTRQFQYNFKKSQAGTYSLRFLQTNNIYLTHTIIVQ